MASDSLRLSTGTLRGPMAGVAAIALALAACSSASPSPTPPEPTATPAPAPPSPTAVATADPLALAALLAGTYTGTWTNQTFGSTGSAEIVATLDHAAGTVTLTITLGGNVFGEPAPPPDSVTITPTGSPSFTYTSPTFGAVTVSVKLTGAGVEITVSAPDVPSARIATFTATGTVTTPTKMDFTYDITFQDGTGPAHGIASLTRS